MLHMPTTEVFQISFEANANEDDTDNRPSEFSSQTQQNISLIVWISVVLFD